MSLTRKHFVVVAEILKKIKDDVDISVVIDNRGKCGARAVLRSVVTDLTVYFKSENAQFDEQRFLKACGVVSE